MDLVASFEESYGYGAFAAALVRHMLERQMPVTLWPLFNHNVPGDLRPFVGRGAQPAEADVAIVAIANNPSGLRAKALFSMYESTKIPADYQLGLRRFGHIIVPTAFSRRAVEPFFRADRIHLCPLGVDTKWQVPSFKPFVFTVVAADHNCPERKRVQEVIAAFSRAFPVEHDVRLQIKRSEHCTPLHTFDSRISVASARMDRANYEAWLGATTVGVQASAMEGWSLPVNEFMALGRPVITPLAGAVADYLPPSAAFPVQHKLRRAPRAVFQATGQVPWADMNHLAAQMRFAYENPYEVVARGLAAARASGKYTAHTMGERFLTVWQTIQSGRRARPAR